MGLEILKSALYIIDNDGNKHRLGEGVILEEPKSDTIEIISSETAESRNNTIITYKAIYS